jgi:predicted transcriptional regulator
LQSVFSFSMDHAVNSSAISPQDDDTPDRALAAIQDTIGVTPDSDDAKLQFRSMYDIANMIANIPRLTFVSFS